MGTEIVSSIQRYEFYNDIQTKRYKAQDEVASTQKEQEKTWSISWDSSLQSVTFDFQAHAGVTVPITKVRS